MKKKKKSQEQRGGNKEREKIRGFFWRFNGGKGGENRQRKKIRIGKGTPAGRRGSG